MAPVFFLFFKCEDFKGATERYAFADCPSYESSLRTLWRNVAVLGVGIQLRTQASGGREKLVTLSAGRDVLRDFIALLVRCLARGHQDAQFFKALVLQGRRQSLSFHRSFVLHAAIAFAAPVPGEATTFLYISYAVQPTEFPPLIVIFLLPLNL